MANGNVLVTCTAEEALADLQRAREQRLKEAERRNITKREQAKLRSEASGIDLGIWYVQGIIRNAAKEGGIAVLDAPDRQAWVWVPQKG